VHWEEVRGPSAIVLLPLGLRRVDSVTHPGHDDDDTNGPVASTTDSDQESGKKSNEPKKGGGAKPKPPSRTVRVTRGGSTATPSTSETERPYARSDRQLESRGECYWDEAGQVLRPLARLEPRVPEE
jgi:hypothetical protein